MRRMCRLSLMCLTALLSGCATQYGCKGMPDEPQCLSTTDAYQVTDKALPAPVKRESDSVDGTIHPSGVPSVIPAQVRQPVPKIDDPTPIRTPAQVMRIWIAPWEDSDGDLMVSNYVYTELEPRRWLIGKRAPMVSPSLIPLQIEQRSPESRSEREVTDSALHGFPTGHAKVTDPQD